MIYLDYAAATPLASDVLKAMLPYLKEEYGNPSSIHQKGREARAAVEQARLHVATFLGCAPKELIFTSGGTEANNWVIFSLAKALRKRGNHIIATAIEHESVLEPLKQLEHNGMKVTYLQPDAKGIISTIRLKKAITPRTIFASIMYANNEIGTVQDISAMATILHKNNIPLHTDACQATAWLPMKLTDVTADFMTINSGKIYGPKGAGALIVREGASLPPLFFGGGQEFRMRSGTENVPAIVGFGEAIRLLPKMGQRVARLRDTFLRQLLAIPGVTLNGHDKKRLPNNVNVRIKGIDNESLLVRLDMEGIAASAGSACTSGAIEPSHVLLALGLPKSEAKSSIRFSLGKDTTKSELDRTVDTLKKIIKDMRSLAGKRKGNRIVKR